MTTQLLTGYTRVQMVLYFFEQHQTGNYSSFYITNYILNTFDIPERKSLNQLYAEVCAVFSTIILHPTKHPVNMVRLGLKGQFLYTYINNQNLNMPEVKYVRRKRNTTKKLEIKPTQQSFEPAKEEIPVQQTLDLDYSTQEIETQDNTSEITINIQNPLQYLMDEIDKMNLPNLNQIILKSTINNKEITITIS
jgi:hypothetical protein